MEWCFQRLMQTEKKCFCDLTCAWPQWSPAWNPCSWRSRWRGWRLWPFCRISWPDTGTLKIKDQTWFFYQWNFLSIIWILIWLMKAHNKEDFLMQTKVVNHWFFCSALFKDLKTVYLSVQHSNIYYQSLCAFVHPILTHPLEKQSRGNSPLCLKLLWFLPICKKKCIKAFTCRNFQWWIECLPDAEWSKRCPSNYESHCHSEGQLRRQS